MLTKGFHQEDTILKYLYDGLTEKSIFNGRVGARIYPSSPLCGRETAINGFINDGFFDSYETIKRPENNLYMSIGENVHQLVSSAFKNQGILIAEEYKLNENKFINLGGILDNLILFNNKISIVEAKTCGDLPSSPKESHRQQCAIYNTLTGFRTYLLYIGRNVKTYRGGYRSLLWRVFEISNDDSVLLKHIIAQQAYKNGRLINRPFSSVSECGYCRHKEICWLDNISIEATPEEIERFTKEGLTILKNILYYREGYVNSLIDDIKRQAIFEKNTSVVRLLNDNCS